MSAQLAHLFIALAVGCALAAVAAVLADGLHLVRRCQVCGSTEDLDGTDLCGSCHAATWGVR